jgi:hypothetical protein
MPEESDGSERPTLEWLASKVASLEAEVARLRAAPAPGDRPGQTRSPSSAGTEQVPRGGEPESPAVSRRGALRALGAAAAGGAGLAIGSTLLGSQPAGAANGDAVFLGQGNAAADSTQVETTVAYGLIGSTTDPAGGGLWGLDGSTSGGTGVLGASTAGVGVTATSSGIVAILGTLTGSGEGAIAGEDQTQQAAPSYGVFGSSISGDGVRATSDTGYGVFATLTGDGDGAIRGIDESTQTDSYGVAGNSNSGFGVVASSVDGIGITTSGGLAPLLLSPAQGLSGPPTGGTHSQGEIYVDEAGAVFVCTADSQVITIRGVGTHITPGTWQQVSLAAPDYNDNIAAISGSLGRAGSLNLLSAPIRVFDTTVADPPALKTRAAGPLAAGSTANLLLTGYAVDGITVPHGAVGVIGNLTALQPAGAGTLIAYPTGSKVPVPPTVSFVKGATTASLCIVGLNTTGHATVKATGSATGCTFDVAGFVF